VAGTAAMPRPSFTSANVVGALTWAVALPVAGYVAYQLPVVRTIAFAVAGIFVAFSLVGMGVLLVRGAARRRDRRRSGDDTAPGGSAAE
jgi:membrane-associated protein